MLRRAVNQGAITAVYLIGRKPRPVEHTTHAIRGHGGRPRALRSVSVLDLFVCQGPHGVTARFMPLLCVHRFTLASNDRMLPPQNLEIFFHEIGALE